MDKDYFMNAGIAPPQAVHSESSMPIPWSGLNDHQSFLGPTSSMDHYSHFDPTWSTTPVTNSAAALRQLIGKLSPAGNSAAFPPASTAVISIPNLPLTPPLPSLSSDPGFAERAAKFSCFGSRSFNGRTSQLGVNNGESGRKLTGPLHRVASSPSLNHNGSSPLENSKIPGSDANSNEESSVSEQIPSGETGSKTSNELNSRKRKAISRGKTKEDRTKGVDGEDDGNVKRSKTSETSKNEEEMNDEREKQKTNQKPPEPPKDYIHVRARRGQATDSHSLAERVRREKISERMKLLQDLVPGCNKVTGKALMLDEIINYVQSLQRQVEFLSMKLASVNPGLDFNMDNLLSSKDMFQQNASLPQQMYPLDSSGPAFYHHQSQQSVPLSQNPVDPTPFDAPPCRSLAIQLDGFSEGLSQFPAFSEDDLHSIVQMGLVQNHVSFSAQNQASNMKVEL